MKRVTSTVAVALSLTLAGGALLLPRRAEAAQPDVEPTGKGIAGGILLGAEIGFVSLAAAGVRAPWAYYTIPPALAVGGGVAGYFVEQAVDTGEAPMAMLFTGAALVIPTLVFTLSATRYEPMSEDNTPVDATPAEAGGSGTVRVGPDATSVTTGSPSSPTPATGGTGGGGTSTLPPSSAAPVRRHLPASDLRWEQQPHAFLNITSDRVALAVPNVALRPTYTARELVQYGITQRYEFHTPLISAAF